MISEGSCDTTKKIILYLRKKLHLKKKKTISTTVFICVNKTGLASKAIEGLFEMYLCIRAGDAFKYKFGLLEMFTGCHIEIR